MQAGEPINQRLLDDAILRILGKLYVNFPVPVAINPIEFVEAPPGKWEAESRDLRATLGRAALEMLDEIECIRHGDITRIGDGTWPNVVLTARGLARMRERPENETDEEKILRIFRRD